MKFKKSIFVGTTLLSSWSYAAGLNAVSDISGNYKKILVSIPSGNIKLNKVSTAGNTLSVKNLGDQDCKLRVRKSDDVLHIDVSKKWFGVLENKQCRFDLDIEVENDVFFELQTVSSIVEVSGLTAGGEIKAISSKVNLSKLSGDYSLDTVSSKIELNSVSGTMAIDAISSSVNLSSEQGSTYVEAKGRVKDTRKANGNPQSSALRLSVEGISNKVTAE